MSEPLYASREQLVDPDDPRGSASRLAYGISLLFHIGIVGFIFFKHLNTSSSSVPQPKVAMIVSITTINPQVKQQAGNASPGIDAETPGQELSPEQQVANPESSADIPAVQSTTTLDPAATAASADEVEPAAGLSDNDAVQNPVSPRISTQDVNKSVTAYIANYKNSLTDDWLSACIQYQNEHGVNTCPPGEEGKSASTNLINAATVELFKTYVTATTDNARVSRQLLEQMDAVLPYMDENSVMGELSRQRYALALEKYCVLNRDCRTVSLDTKNSFSTPVSNDGIIEIMSVGE